MNSPSSAESTPAPEAVQAGARPAASDSSVVPPRVAPLQTISGPMGALLAVAVVAIAIVGWQWYDSRTQVGALRDELARRLAEGEVRNKEAVSTARESQTLVRDLTSKVESLESGLAESQNQQVALEALYQQLSRNSDEWALAEIEQTLTFAAQQLQLAGNVKAAILALQNADMRLSRIDRPQLAPLRKVLERDIERLRVAPHVDVVGLSARIDAVMESVDTLPLAMQQRPPSEATVATAQAAESNAVARLLREIWTDLRSLVRIQNVERPDVPLIDPGQTFFLRENLRLRLLSARIALLQRDQKTYHADLQAVRQWLERFYDTRDRNLTVALNAVRQLSEAQIGVDVPDINASLGAVRDYKLTRDKGVR